ncbi:MAG: TIGR03960 family B12-binding radical SAM protein [Firmicutes bacterium]|nr:TIGR03960 family B12-binding radical SAM protein [Bacillota bacterium]
MAVHIDNTIRRVSKPARYTGGEWNQVVKDHNEVDVSFAFAFPDLYEVGMSNLGLKIVYHLLNRRKDVVCERVFAPWIDMEALMRKHRIPLFSLETRKAIGEFDVVGFTLQYELTYTNIVNMLDLAGIPVMARDRTERDPLIVGGGPGALNPEPVADMFDCLLVGDAEDALDEMVDVYLDWKRHGGRRQPGARESLLEAMATIEGCYVPSLYRPEYNPDGTVRDVRPSRSGVPPGVRRRIAAPLDLADYPLAPPVPFMEVVHDRAVVELFRGCTRGCRFCQAGMIYRPVRERPLEDVVRASRELVRNTGYDEVSLMSLSSTDYSGMSGAVRRLVGELGPLKVNLSLPSLRVDAFSVGIAEQIHSVRKSGLTFAPEAGTQRLRDVINKRVTDDDILEASRAAFEAGWDAIKFYFMVGLPTETEADLVGVVSLIGRVAALYGRMRRSDGRAARGRPKLTVSASSFVPKAHTPFQWEGQATTDELEAKQAFLRDRLRPRGVRLDWHDAEMSAVEAAIARGDRRLTAVLIAAWKRGTRFDSWTEMFEWATWNEAFRDCGVDPSFYANRRRPDTEVFPWEHIDARVSKGFLLRERDKALAGITTPDCRSGVCEACGACG